MKIKVIELFSYLSYSFPVSSQANQSAFRCLSFIRVGQKYFSHK